MVDIVLLAALLAALRPHCRLILVGDADQLPSVGPGKAFADIIRSGQVPTVRLTEVFRQAQQSCIVRNAHQIHAGILPDLELGGTDSRHLTAICGSVVRFSPIEATPEQLGAMHGINEHVSIAALTRAVEFYRAYLTGFDEKS